MKVLIIGASEKPERYAYIAMKELSDKGHEVLLFNPAREEIEGRKVYHSLAEVPGPIDTLSLYVGPQRLIPMIDEIIALQPRRIISNPGTETTELRNRATEAGIDYLEACTIMMSKTGQF